MPILLIFILFFPLLGHTQDALVPPPSPFAIITSPYPITVDDIPLEQGQKIGALTFQDAVQLRSESYRFGGFSGLSIFGNQLYAISDEGRLLRTTLNRKENKIASLDGGSLRALWGDAEEPEKEAYDSEALVHIKGNQFLVGFEQQHRLQQYQFGNTIIAQKSLPAPAALSTLTKENEGIEALAPLSHNTYVALTENARDTSNNIIGYIVDIKTNNWQPFTLKATGDFRPTDLAILNKKYLLLLERSYSVFGGTEARLSLINRGDIKPDAIITTTELARFDADSGIDNMEGLSITQNRNGTADIFLISDDNFNPLQKTILVWLKYAH